MQGTDTTSKDHARRVQITYFGIIPQLRRTHSK